uniref:Ig-like domain-containing protein n=1 Tax=Scleropages formosus TaxID=113540 RepID=A0A8C9VGL0_SCLFO
LLLSLSQPPWSHQARPGDEVTLECHVSLEAYAKTFWLKQPPEGRPTCVAVATFKDHPRLTAKRNSYSFNISFPSLDLSDTATYYCGALAYNRVSFGNGTKLHPEEEERVVPELFISFGHQEQNPFQVISPLLIISYYIYSFCLFIVYISILY